MKESQPDTRETANQYERALFGGCALLLVVSSFEFMREVTEIGLRFALYGHDGITPDSISKVVALGTIAAVQIAAIKTLPEN